LHFDVREGFFIGRISVKSAWETMVADLGLPGESEGGVKLVRSST
jgi:hypothetical protein